jgi:3-deoxy-manno-octulosonate cytidylyltransferase (CMP-KDO synthetase)
MRTAIAIPARLASVRFPRKILADLCGKPMIQHVYEAVKRSGVSDEIYILVDSAETEDVVKSFGANAIMTSPNCYCGTDRIVSVLDQIGGDFIVNVQGDEPFIDRKILIGIRDRALVSSADIITPIFRITDPADIDDPCRVKVVIKQNGCALYFSRSPIPFIRGVDRSEWLAKGKFFGHIGVYGYRRHTLENYHNLLKSELEAAESLEQLRFLDNGYAIDTAMAERPTIGIDTRDDLQKAIDYIKASQL